MYPNRWSAIINSADNSTNRVIRYSSPEFLAKAAVSILAILSLAALHGAITGVYLTSLNPWGAQSKNPAARA